MQAGEHPQVIATKLLPPRCVGLIERPRLLDLVPEVQTKRLSVIKAPAGFGKTSLAAEWVGPTFTERKSGCVAFDRCQ